jgi:hypothetical protein
MIPPGRPGPGRLLFQQPARRTLVLLLGTCGWGCDEGDVALAAPRRIEVRVGERGEVLTALGNTFVEPGKVAEIAVPAEGPFTLHWRTASRTWTFVEVEPRGLDLRPLVEATPVALSGALVVRVEAPVGEVVEVAAVSGGRRLLVVPTAVGTRVSTGPDETIVLAAWRDNGLLSRWAMASVPADQGELTLEPRAPDRTLRVGLEGTSSAAFTLTAMVDGVDTGLRWAEGRVGEGTALALALPGDFPGVEHAWRLEASQSAFGLPTPPERSWVALLPTDRDAHVFTASPVLEVAPALVERFEVPLPLDRAGAEVRVTPSEDDAWLQVDLDADSECEPGAWTLLVPEGRGAFSWPEVEGADPLDARRLVGAVRRVRAGLALDTFLESGAPLESAEGEASVQGVVGYWRGDVRPCAGASQPSRWRVLHGDEGLCDASGAVVSLAVDACGRVSFDGPVFDGPGAAAAVFACGRLLGDRFEDRTGARFAVTESADGTLRVAHPTGEYRWLPWEGVEPVAGLSASDALAGVWSRIEVRSDFVPVDASGEGEVVADLRIVHARDDGRRGGGLRIDRTGVLTLDASGFRRRGRIERFDDADAVTNGAFSWAPSDCDVGGRLELRGRALTLTWDEPGEPSAGPGVRRFRAFLER